jgi:cyclopropane fatty-acyl-phospholipid synthase-like methyltransferase
VPEKFDLYNPAYGNFADDAVRSVRDEVYGEDLGQTGWMTAAEYRGFLKLLDLRPGAHVLEVGFGAGGCALYAAETAGVQVTGIDINENAVRNARKLAADKGLESRARFERIDSSQTLPFSEGMFDAIFSNDAICHLVGRAAVLKEWHRVLKPGGRLLFSDAMILTGILSSEELLVRSSIGFYLFLPAGENERLVRNAGFTLLRADDLTSSAEAIAKKRHDARERRRDDLIRIEGEANFLGVQKFLSCVHTVSKERRLSRYAYLAQKSSA